MLYVAMALLIICYLVIVVPVALNSLDPVRIILITIVFFVAAVIIFSLFHDAYSTKVIHL